MQTRRTILGYLISLVALIFTGCRKVDQAANEPSRQTAVGDGDPTRIDPVGRLADRLTLYAQADIPKFDPFTISIIASLLCSVIRFCWPQTALRIQRKVKQKPKGATAVQLRQKIRDHFLEHRNESGLLLFRDDADVEQHVETTMQAFVDATPDELTKLLNDLKSTYKPDNPKAFGVAGEWSRLDV